MGGIFAYILLLGTFTGIAIGLFYMLRAVKLI